MKTNIKLFGQWDDNDYYVLFTGEVLIDGYLPQLYLSAEIEDFIDFRDLASGDMFAFTFIEDKDAVQRAITFHKD